MTRRVDTARGARHLGELPEAAFFAPNEVTNPLFAGEFYRAVENGVEVYPYHCSISVEEISINENVPVVNKN